MSAALHPPDAPVVSVAGAIAGMETIEAALPGVDGLACFDRMYHDLPVAMVSTCAALAAAPDAAPHLADHQKVDQLLNAAEQSIRQSFENTAEAADRHGSGIQSDRHLDDQHSRRSWCGMTLITFNVKAVEKSVTARSPQIRWPQHALG